MTSKTASWRPRLGTHVLARRHVIDGVSGVVLFDVRDDEVLRIGSREWAILAAADGTRDVPGIVLAAQREGVTVAVQEAQTFLQALAERGLVIEGADPIPGPAPLGPPPERPVRALPGYRLSCDRSGRCCRMYATVLLTLAEAERARVVLPERMVGAVAPDHAFLPVRGSVVGGAVAVVARDGACGYLDQDGACAIHKVAGAQAKPMGCRVFPATFIDDGEEIRVSIKAECACVLDSVGGNAGDPLVDPSVTRAADLSPAIVVECLPDPVAVTDTLREPRASFVAWSAAWLDAPTPGDVARACWLMADALPDGLGPALRAWVDSDANPQPIDPAAVEPFVRALARRASARTRVDVQWRSVHDRVRTVGAWVARTAVTCRQPMLLGEVLALGPEQPAREAFFVRAAVFGYGVCDEDFAGLQRGLRDLAIKIWVARAMPTFAPDTAQGEAEDALTALEAWLRAYGGWRYILDV